MKYVYLFLQQPERAAVVILIMTYLFLLNLLGIIFMGKDKIAALENRFRISEKTLFVISLLGGSLGTFVGMHVFHHKTKHWYFRVFMPLIMMVHVVIIGFLIYTSVK